MSSAGSAYQPDPLDMAAMGPAAPQGAAGGDALDMAAAGHFVPAPPATAPAQQQQPGWHGPAWADPSGKFSAAVRNFTNGLSFNVADPAAAAIGAIHPALNGYASTKPTYGERFNELLDWSRGDTDAGATSHPVLATAAKVAGAVANPVNRFVPAPTSIWQAAGQGAAYGAADAAGGDVGSQKSKEQIMGDMLMGGGTGAATGGATYTLGKLLSGATRTPSAQALKDEGVPTTIGQAMGGGFKTMEEAQTSVPFFGNAIKARQREGFEELNRASYNRVLEPLGVEYAADAPVGNKGIETLQKTIDDAYSRVYHGATVPKTNSVVATVQDALSEAATVLPPARVKQIRTNVDRMFLSKFDEGGNLSGDALKTAKNWFSEQSRVGATSSLDDKATAAAYGSVVQAIKQGIGEGDSERGALLSAADKSWGLYRRVADAASSNNASGHGGTFSANQLGQALRRHDNSTGRLDFAKGQEPLQDLAQAGQESLTQTLPDSGTAMRYIMEHPISAALLSPYWASGKALYSKKGQQLGNMLLFGGSKTRQPIGKAVQRLGPMLSAATVPAVAAEADQ